ncbi:hypothetical protein [Alteromonas stellipolaris]|uniref:hypothetical protein n=1 Tax=Alteromonas stellipolaris TaxID=233316 RepID=UPI0012EDA419|nr:hypothetical protein [Alteromonas stellipolaris]
MIRFYDMRAGECRTFPRDIDNKVALFDFCYRCLVEPIFLSRQWARRSAFWREQGGLSYLPLSFYQRLNTFDNIEMPYLKKLNASEKLAHHVSQFQTQSIILPRKAIEEDKLSAHFHLDMATLSNCLSLDISDITSLVEQGVLIPRNPASQARDLWFDARDIDIWYGQITEIATEHRIKTNLIKIGDALEVLRRYKWRVGHIFALIKNKKIDVYLEPKDTIDSITNLTINREQLFEALNATYFQRKSNIKISHIQHFFFAHDRYINLFVGFIKKTYLRQSRWQSDFMISRRTLLC